MPSGRRRRCWRPISARCRNSSRTGGPGGWRRRETCPPGSPSWRGLPPTVRSWTASAAISKPVRGGPIPPTWRGLTSPSTPRRWQEYGGPHEAHRSGTVGWRRPERSAHVADNGRRRRYAGYLADLEQAPDAQGNGRDLRDSDLRGARGDDPHAQAALRRRDHGDDRRPPGAGHVVRAGALEDAFRHRGGAERGAGPAIAGSGAEGDPATQS